MAEEQATARAALVLGARHLGGAIAERIMADGWRTAAVARTVELLARVRERGALAIPPERRIPISSTPRSPRPAVSWVGWTSSVTISNRSEGGPHA